MSYAWLHRLQLELRSTAVQWSDEDEEEESCRSHRGWGATLRGSDTELCWSACPLRSWRAEMYLHSTAGALSRNPPCKRAHWQSAPPSAHSPLASRPPLPTWHKGRRGKVGQADLLVPSIKRSAWVKGTGRVAAEFFIKDVPQFPACSAQGAQVTAEPSHQCRQIQPDILTQHTTTQRETLNYGGLARKPMMTWLQDKNTF